MIKAVIFDFFGVIITDGLDPILKILDDSDPAARAFVKEKVSQSSMGLLSTEESTKLIADRLGITPEQWRQDIKDGEYINEPLLSYIEKSLRPKYKIALLSNVARGGLERRIGRDVLDNYFDLIITSAEIGMVKPDPEIYRHTLEKLGVKSKESVFIDDREKYCKGAESLGIKAILYQDFKQMKSQLETILATVADN